MKISKTSTAEQQQEFIKNNKDSPVVMVNLLTFKEHVKSKNKEITGEKCYENYSINMKKYLASKGCRVIWQGQVDSMLIGESDVNFSFIALVEYPNRQTFIEMISSSHYTQIKKDREDGLAGQWLFATTQIFPSKKQYLICNCVLCQDIATRYNLKNFSFKIPLPCFDNKIIIRKKSLFSNKTKNKLFKKFSIPSSYKYVDYTQVLNQAWKKKEYNSSQPKKMVAFFCKFVNSLQKYQSAEIWVLEEGNFFYCIMIKFEELQDGDEERYNLIDLASTKELSDLSLLRNSLLNNFKQNDLKISFL